MKIHPRPARPVYNYVIGGGHYPQTPVELVSKQTPVRDGLARGQRFNGQRLLDLCSK